MKTKFRYTNVASQDFGLSNEEIFMLDDKQLNAIVSLKKYRPYRNMNDEG
jgi:protein KRI1